jgi:hypothetical protein
MNNIDLDLNNYNYDELLQLFKIKELDDKQYFKHIIDEKLNHVKEKYPGDIYNFFYKSKLAILTIFNLIQNNIISDRKNEVNTFLSQLKGVTSLENYTEMDLYNKIINQNNIQEFEKEVLNEKYNDVGGGRVNPSLSNKNNTNLIFNTAVNEISPGNLNSVKRIIQYYNLNLNSCFRNNYYQNNPCDFTYMIPSEIKNVVAMRLVSIEIPNSWYLFSKLKKNNIFEIIIEENKKTYGYKIEIPDGNYDSETLQEYLNSNFFYNSGMDNYLKYIKFTINHHNLKSKFEIIDTDTSEKERKKFTFSLKFTETTSQNIMNTFGWIIGYRMANYIHLQESESEGLFDAGGDRYIYLCINDFQYNNNPSNLVCFDKSTLNEDVIAKIPMVNGKLSLIVNDNNSALSKIRLYNGPVNLSKLQIKILDRFGSVIDLNNMDFSLTLELQILYESFNFQNVMA